MKGQPRISSIYHQKNGDAPIGAEAERRNLSLFCEAWRKRGLLVIDPEDVNNDYERQVLINVANQRYGRRGGRK